MKIAPATISTVNPILLFYYPDAGSRLFADKR